MRGVSGDAVGSAALPDPRGLVRKLVGRERCDGEKGEYDEDRGEQTLFVDGVEGLRSLVESR